MILLDTHVWVWWVHKDPRLTVKYREIIHANETEGIGVSAISCWEIAKLIELHRINVRMPTLEWLDLALAYPGVQLVPITPRICAESTQLPGEFHRDPMDQIIVATARVLDVPLLTEDSRILSYPHIRLLPSQ